MKRKLEELEYSISNLIGITRLLVDISRMENVRMEDYDGAYAIVNDLLEGYRDELKEIAESI